jgi:rare lipoprotein A
MLNTNNVAPGRAIRSRRAFALIAATLLMGGGISEASAKSRHHRHHSHHAQKAKSNWMNANAAIGSSGGHSFSGKASFYGNESAARPLPVSASIRTP